MLTERPVDRTTRIEPLLRSLVFWLRSPDELAEHLDREVTFYRDTAADGITPPSRAAGDSLRTRSRRVTVEAAVRVYDGPRGLGGVGRVRPGHHAVTVGRLVTIGTVTTHHP